MRPPARSCWRSSSYARRSRCRARSCATRDRGAEDVDFGALDEAARRIVDRGEPAVFHAWEKAGIEGITRPRRTSRSRGARLRATRDRSRARSSRCSRRLGGPYGLALGPESTRASWRPPSTAATRCSTTCARSSGARSSGLPARGRGRGEPARRRLRSSSRRGPVDRLRATRRRGGRALHRGVLHLPRTDARGCRDHRGQRTLGASKRPHRHIRSRVGGGGKRRAERRPDAAQQGEGEKEYGRVRPSTREEAGGGGEIEKAAGGGGVGEEGCSTMELSREAHRPTPAAPPGHETWRRRYAISSAPRRAARSCCWPRRSLALLWANSPWSHSYEGLWTTKLVDHDRRRRDLRGPAPLGQRGADDVLLPRRRAGGQARVRPRRAARAPPPDDSRARRTRRDGGPDRDLSRLQRGRSRRPRLGGGDVDRHGLCPRRARAAHAPCGHPAARLPADAGRRRRPLRAAGDRHRVHDPRLDPRAGDRGRAVRGAAARCATPRVASPGVDRHRRRALGRDVRVGHRPGRLRARRRARHQRLPAIARESRAGDRAGALVSRAAHPRARALGAAGSARRDLAERAPAVQAAPMDQLRDRAAVCAGQRRRARDRRPARRRDPLTDHARHPDRLPASASRWASPAPRCSPRGRRCTGRARRSAPRCSPPVARSRESGSRSRC